MNRERWSPLLYTTR